MCLFLKRYFWGKNTRITASASGLLIWIDRSLAEADGLIVPDYWAPNLLVVIKFLSVLIIGDLKIIKFSQTTRIGPCMASEEKYKVIYNYIFFKSLRLDLNYAKTVWTPLGLDTFIISCVIKHSTCIIRRYNYNVSWKQHFSSQEKVKLVVLQLHLVIFWRQIIIYS